jgi:hypothetical protein
LNEGELKKLSSMVESLLKDDKIIKIIENLKMKIKDSDEPFIWNNIDENYFHEQVPLDIKSGWIFALKKDTPSIQHYHPNSVQHTVMIEGKGKVRIGDWMKELEKFKPYISSGNDIWYIIDKNIPHEFFPQEEDMVVISFHTCASKDLIEIKCANHKTRKYG